MSYWQKNVKNYYKFLKHLCFQLVKILIHQLFTLKIENYVNIKIQRLDIPKNCMC